MAAWKLHLFFIFILLQATQLRSVRPLLLSYSSSSSLSFLCVLCQHGQLRPRCSSLTWNFCGMWKGWCWWLDNEVFAIRRDESTLTALYFGILLFFVHVLHLQFTVHTNKASGSADVFFYGWSSNGGPVALSYLGASVSPHLNPAWPCCTYSFWEKNRKKQEEEQDLQSFQKLLVSQQGTNISEKKLKEPNGTNAHIFFRLQGNKWSMELQNGNSIFFCFIFYRPGHVVFT